MRLAFVGDWHASSAAAVAAVKTAVDMELDVLVHVGDFFYTGEIGNRFLNTLNKVLKRYGKGSLKVVFVRGNHDDTNALARFTAKAQEQDLFTSEGFVPVREQVFYAPNGLRWNWEGVSFAALGGAASVDKKFRVENKSWWADECVADSDVDAVIEGGRVDVLVMHDIPQQVYVPDDSGLKFDLRESLMNQALLGRAVGAVRPQWMFSGHFHRFQTQRVNYFDGTEGTSVILDRGDYVGEEDSPKVLGASMYFMEIQDKEIHPVRF